MRTPEQITQQMSWDLEEAWKKVLATEEGQRVLWCVLEKAHIFQNSYSPNSDASAFNEGERSVGLRLLTEHILPVYPSILGDLMEGHAARMDELERAQHKEENENEH